MEIEFPVNSLDILFFILQFVEFIILVVELFIFILVNVDVFDLFIDFIVEFVVFLILVKVVVDIFFLVFEIVELLFLVAFDFFFLEFLLAGVRAAGVGSEVDHSSHGASGRVGLSRVASDRVRSSMEAVLRPGDFRGEFPVFKSDCDGQSSPWRIRGDPRAEP